MNEQQLAVLIPILAILVTGLVLVTHFYLRSRERQMLIEKGLDAASIKEFFDQKRDPLRLLKMGIIIIGFGLGLGFGLMLEDVTGKEFYVPFSLFVLTGLGFVTANIVASKSSKNNA